jgi:hypothetical protein
MLSISFSLFHLPTRRRRIRLCLSIELTNLPFMALINRQILPLSLKIKLRK